MQSLLILGRQPELGLAELESLYGDDKLTAIGDEAVIVDVDPCLLAFKRLGGSIKFAKLLTNLDASSWHDALEFLVKVAPQHAANIPEGKMNLGLSLYGFDIDVRSITKGALIIKRAIQKTGRNVRLVPNKAPELNTAQVIHNKLTNEKSWELLIIKAENKIYIAQTVMVQDISAYSKRDQARPHRDSRVGMLPPKLAQIIINLAVGKLDEDKLESICDTETGNDDITKLNQTVLDPFCGSGVIPQEALLMGYDITATDLNPRMVEFTKGNLKWLAERYKISYSEDDIAVDDAMNKKWSKFDFIASEANLGIPLNQLPSDQELKNIINGVNALIESFLKNVASQTGSGQRLCLAVPAWQISPDNFKFLPVIDHLTDLGYNFIDFKSIEGKQLIYYRPNQLVARQLLTLIRK